MSFCVYHVDYQTSAFAYRPIQFTSSRNAYVSAE